MPFRNSERSSLMNFKLYGECGDTAVRSYVLLKPSEIITKYSPIARCSIIRGATILNCLRGIQYYIVGEER